MQLDVLLWFQSIRNPILDVIFLIITTAGGKVFLSALIGVIFWCKDKNLGFKWAFIMLSGTVINAGMKTVIASPRPIGAEGLDSLAVDTASGKSFPSGHTQGATMIATSAHFETRTRKSLILATLFVVSVGFSRMYLGVHWPVDIIGGIVVGLLWVVFTYRMVDWKSFNSVALFYGIVLALSVVAAIILKNQNLSITTAGLMGLYLGYLFESKYVDFKNPETLSKRIVVLAVGGVFMAFSGLVLYLLMGLSLVTIATLAFLASGVYPMIIKKIA